MSTSPWPDFSQWAGFPARPRPQKQTQHIARLGEILLEEFPSVEAMVDFANPAAPLMVTRFLPVATQAPCRGLRDLGTQELKRSRSSKPPLALVTSDETPMKALRWSLTTLVTPCHRDVAR